MEKIFAQLNKLLESELAQLADISARIWMRGWAEANAGNVSLRITRKLIDGGLTDPLDDYEYYLVSKSGSRYRQMESDPLSKMLLIRVRGNSQEQYPPSGKASSELQSHLKLQDKFIRESPETVFILHSHPLEVIALSQVLVGKSFSMELSRVLPELKLYLPQGIAYCPQANPGSLELAELSCKNLTDEKALVWQAHGLLCFGSDPDEAFDYMEIICKAAALYLLMNRS